MTTWAFNYVGDQELQGLLIELTEYDVMAGGSLLSPHLRIRPQIIWRQGSSYQNLRGQGIHAMSVSLYNDEQRLLGHSGFLPYNHQSTALEIPISRPWIDQESRKSGPAVTCYLSFAILHTLRNVVQTSITDQQSIRILRQNWLNILPHWGYPQTRLIAINLELPATPLGYHPGANKVWQQTISRMHYAESTILSPGTLHDYE